MRNLFWLVFAGAGLGCLPMTAAAATTGSVTINGKVPISCAIVVTPAAGASNIADISAGNTNLLVATVTENCNDPSGYSVSLAGANSGSYTGLFKDSVSAATVAFNVSYAGTSVSGATVTNVAAPANTTKNVQITYAATPNLTGSVGYTYAETLTFTITAK